MSASTVGAAMSDPRLLGDSTRAQRTDAPAIVFGEAAGTPAGSSLVYATSRPHSRRLQSAGAIGCGRVEKQIGKRALREAAKLAAAASLAEQREGLRFARQMGQRVQQLLGTDGDAGGGQQSVTDPFWDAAGMEGNSGSDGAGDLHGLTSESSSGDEERSVPRSGHYGSRGAFPLRHRGSSMVRHANVRRPGAPRAPRIAGYGPTRRMGAGRGAARDSRALAIAISGRARPPMPIRRRSSPVMRVLGMGMGMPAAMFAARGTGTGGWGNPPTENVENDDDDNGESALDSLPLAMAFGQSQGPSLARALGIAPPGSAAQAPQASALSPLDLLGLLPFAGGPRMIGALESLPRPARPRPPVQSRPASQNSPPVAATIPHNAAGGVGPAAAMAPSPPVAATVPHNTTGAVRPAAAMAPSPPVAATIPHNTTGGRHAAVAPLHNTTGGRDAAVASHHNTTGGRDAAVAPHSAQAPLVNRGVGAGDGTEGKDGDGRVADGGVDDVKVGSNAPSLFGSRSMLRILGAPAPLDPRLAALSSPVMQRLAGRQPYFANPPPAFAPGSLTSSALPPGGLLSALLSIRSSQHDSRGRTSRSARPPPSRPPQQRQPDDWT
jgi:hypothetical protein